MTLKSYKYEFTENFAGFLADDLGGNKCKMNEHRPALSATAL